MEDLTVEQVFGLLAILIILTVIFPEVMIPAYIIIGGVWLAWKFRYEIYAALRG